MIGSRSLVPQMRQEDIMFGGEIQIGEVADDEAVWRKAAWNWPVRAIAMFTVMVGVCRFIASTRLRTPAKKDRVVEPIVALLRNVRRRLRLAWLSVAAQWYLSLGLVVTILVGVGRFVDWPWIEKAAWALVVVIAIGLVLVALGVRIPDRFAALAADKGLRTKYALTASLEFGDSDSMFAAATRDRAAQVATGVRPADAVPISVVNRGTARLAALSLVAIGLTFVENPQDAIRARCYAEQRILDRASDKLKERSKELDKKTEAEKQLALNA